MKLPSCTSEELGIDDIHTWFGLSYCAYLVLPRSVLQAMPEDWQRRFLRLIDEIQETLEYEGADYNYMVKRRIGSGQFAPDPLANYRYPPPIVHKQEGVATMARQGDDRDAHLPPGERSAPSERGESGG